MPDGNFNKQNEGFSLVSLGTLCQQPDSSDGTNSSRKKREVISATEVNTVTKPLYLFHLEDLQKAPQSWALTGPQM